jgi:hypothetical protein
MLINYLAAISRELEYSRIGFLIIVSIFQISCMNVHKPRIRSMHALLISYQLTPTSFCNHQGTDGTIIIKQVHSLCSPL